MNTIEKVKLMAELKSLAKQIKAKTLTGLKLIQSGKRIKELRRILGFESISNTKEYADVLVKDTEGKLLLVQRRLTDTFKPGHWWIAGGHIEKDESVKEAAMRELYEETGISAADLTFLEKSVLENGGTSTRYVYTSESHNVELQKDELENYVWVSLEEAKNYQLVGSYEDLKALFHKSGETQSKELTKSLELPENPKKSDLSKAINQWLKENTQGQTITTSDGKKVKFNANFSTKHLTHDGRKSELSAKAITFVRSVFEDGIFTGRQELTKDRGNKKDNFIAFHSYEKWVEIDGYRLLLEAKAGENENGLLEAIDDEIIAYHQKIKEKTVMTRSDLEVDSVNQAGSYANYGSSHSTTILDNVQDENLALLTILEITDLDGNPINLDEEPQTVKASENHALFNYNGENSTSTQRQKANDTAVDIIQLVVNGELAIDDVSPEQKALLSQYSGHGGGLKNKITGKTGSPYEYYTPKEIAGGMWELLKGAGFNGGRVLDPCAGTGIFSAVAPENALIDSVELDSTSGTINQIIFNDDKHNVTISPFEKIASATEDEIYDAVISNVPFGDNASRGENKLLDKRYQKDSLDADFIKRSLDKLRPNGLAVFMSGPTIITGAKFRKVREQISQKAEFIGAYRLPNKLFHNAGADTMTDVMVFKKHSKENQEIIMDLVMSNRAALVEANVLWKPFISGGYYAEYPQNVLGTASTVVNRFGKEVEALESEFSLAEIAKLMNKFGGSRIEWEKLDAEENGSISYENGDNLYFGGILKTYQNGKWINAEIGEFEPNLQERLHSELLKYSDPVKILEEKRPLARLAQIIQEIQKYSLTISILPQWVLDMRPMLTFPDESELDLMVKVLAFIIIKQKIMAEITCFSFTLNVHRHSKL